MKGVQTDASTVCMPLMMTLLHCWLAWPGLLQRVAIEPVIACPPQGLEKQQYLGEAALINPVPWFHRPNNPCTFCDLANGMSILDLRVSHRLHPRRLELSMFAMRIW
jgi:hypothetical protein